MIGEVVDIRMLSKQLCTELEIDAYDQTIWLGGFVGRYAGQQLAAQLQRRGAIGGAGDDIGQGEAKLFDRIKGEHWRSSWQRQQAGARLGTSGAILDLNGALRQRARDGGS
jgi:hypothetical protein